MELSPGNAQSWWSSVLVEYSGTAMNGENLEMHRTAFMAPRESRRNLQLERINAYFNEAAGGRYVSRDI